MHLKNRHEHALILDEMSKIRECITNFTGYVLGGSGILTAILVAGASTKIEATQIGYTSLLSSVIISLVLLIILYKFNSHNRMAGYCKVLSHENYHIADGDNNNIFVTWEICIGRLMHYSLPSNSPKEVYRSIEKLCQLINSEDINKRQLIKLVYYITVTPSPIDNAKFLKGFKVIYEVLTNRLNTESWAYPAYITSIFLSITLTMITFGVTATMINFLGVDKTIISNWTLPIFCCFIMLLQFYLWRGFIGKLFCLMSGTATVDAFFWRFLAIRGRVISQTGSKLYFNHLHSWFEETGQNLDKKIKRLAKKSKYKRVIKTYNDLSK